MAKQKQARRERDQNGRMPIGQENVSVVKLPVGQESVASQAVTTREDDDEPDKCRERA